MISHISTCDMGEYFYKQKKKRKKKKKSGKLANATSSINPWMVVSKLMIIIKALCLTEECGGFLLERKASDFSFTSLTFLDVKSNVDVKLES